MARMVLWILATLYVSASRAHRPTGDHQHSKVINLMKQVLCRNFPDVPCDVIMTDAKLTSLISLSVQQIRSQLSSPAPLYQNKDSAYDSEAKTIKKKRKKLNSNILQRKMISGNDRKMTKFFPQKFHNDYNDQLTIENQLSNSDGEVFRGKNDFSWKMDYMKHGEPSFSEDNVEQKEMGDRKSRRKYVMKPNLLLRKRLRPDQLHQHQHQHEQ